MNMIFILYLWYIEKCDMQVWDFILNNKLKYKQEIYIICLFQKKTTYTQYI